MKPEAITPGVTVEPLDLSRIEREVAEMRRVLALQDEHAELTRQMAERGLSLADAARTMAEIAAFVAMKHGLPVDVLRGHAHKTLYAPARQEAMWIMRQRRRPNGSYRWSLSQIGVFLGGRHYTSILNGVRRHQARIDAGG